MIAGRNIVCIGSNWFDHPTSKHHVMRRLAADNHVIWVNFHASRRPRLTRDDTLHVFHRLREAWHGPQRVAEQIDMLSPLLVPLPKQPFVRRLNAWVLERQIRRALRNLPPRPLQLWLFTPDVPELLPRLRAERVVYYCVDDFAAFAGFDAALMESLETQTMAASDIVLTTSRPLYDARRERHPCVHLFPHGVDVEHFAKARTWADDALPADLCDVSGPIFGYMGLISDYVDLELIATTARARPDWTFVLIGKHVCSLEVLEELVNVRILGPRPYEQMPAYCRRFDVGLIPFRMNRLTRAVNPIKLREYLAAGLPVVSTPLDEVRPYEPAVRVAAGCGPFIAACAAALEDARRTPAALRQALVDGESWAARVAWLAELVKARPCTSAAETDLREADTFGAGRSVRPNEPRGARFAHSAAGV